MVIMLGYVRSYTQPTHIYFLALFQIFTNSVSGTLIAFIQRLRRQVKPSFVYEASLGIPLQNFAVPVDAQTLKKCNILPVFICLSIFGSAPFILGIEESKNLSLSNLKFLGLKSSFNTYREIV